MALSQTAAMPKKREQKKQQAPAPQRRRHVHIDGGLARYLRAGQNDAYSPGFFFVERNLGLKLNPIAKLLAPRRCSAPRAVCRSPAER
jgi:hypothetical protein